MTELEFPSLDFRTPLVIGAKIDIFTFFTEDEDIHPGDRLKLSSVKSSGSNIVIKVISYKRDPQNGATDIVGILKKINYPLLARAVLVAGADNENN